MRNFNLSQGEILQAMIEERSLELQVLQMTDQPETCSLCGSRTQFTDFNEKQQLHTCLNEECKFTFLLEED